MKAQKPVRGWVRIFLPLLRPFWKEIALAGLAMVLAGLATVLRPWPLKVVVDRVLTHKVKNSHLPYLQSWLNHASYTPWQILYGACVATVLIALIGGISTYLYTRILGNVGQRYVFDLRQKLFAHMQRLSLRFHDSQRTGDLVTRLTSDIQSVRELISNSIMVFGANILQLLGMLLLMFWLDWRLTLAALSVIPLLLIAVFHYTYRIKQATRRARKSTGLMAGLAQEALASIRLVQGLAQEDQMDERFAERSRGNLEAFLDSVNYQARLAPSVDFLAALALAAVIWYGGAHALRGQLTTGDVVIFFAYVTNFYKPIRALARFSNLFNRAIVGAERIADVLSVQNDMLPTRDAHPAPCLRGEIEFRDVSFDYEPGQRILSGINLWIAPGEKVAIVGSTGAGKSTLVGLVPRFYDPTEGAVLIDGEDIRHYTMDSLRKQISLVLQDSLLFSGTIRQNIAFGCPGARDEAIAAAARTANADEFIERLPQGYDTPVSERATTLSGGQKQRLAIARAVLRDAPIVILDEPTTGLDAAAERAVLEALKRAVAGRTALIIAHRLATVRLADRILVLDRGQIVEEGTHSELVALNGRYAHLWKLQTSIYPEEALVSTATLATPQNPLGEGRTR